MSVDTIKAYPVGVAQSDIPSSWTPSNEPRVVSGGSKRIVAISSQNGTVAAGQPLSFQLPANMGAGFLVSGSAYIRMTVSVTQANAYLWAFKHYGSGSSIVQSAQFLMGGAQVENIQMYNKLYSSLLNHATNFSFVATDDRLAQFSYAGAFSSAQTTQICIPVMLGCFNSSRDLPLFLTSANQLQLILDSAVAATASGSADPVTDYQVSNATLIFEQMVPDSGYEASIKQMLAQRLYQVPISTWTNNRFAQVTTLNQNIVLNTSSLKAVLWNHVKANAARKLQQFYDGGQTSAQLYLDGALVSNSTLGNAPEQFLEMNRCLNTMFDCTRTSVVPVAANNDGNAVANDFTPTATGASRALYSGAAFLCGLACQRTREDGFAMTGTPVSSAVLNLVGADSGGETYVYCAVDQIIAIDGAGNATLIR